MKNLYSLVNCKKFDKNYSGFALSFYSMKGMQILKELKKWLKRNIHNFPLCDAINIRRQRNLLNKRKLMKFLSLSSSPPKYLHSKFQHKKYIAKTSSNKSLFMGPSNRSLILFIPITLKKNNKLNVALSLISNTTSARNEMQH